MVIVRITAVVLVAAATYLSSGAVAAVAGTGDARVQCTITDPRIGESSGLAAAGDRLYTVNDSGDRLRVFVLDQHCRVTSVINGGVDPYDVEDLARTGDGTLWLCDTGDNDEVRRTVALELIAEDGRTTLYRFTYPDGPHDAEALLVDHAGRPYIVTKQPLGASAVYTPTATPSTAHPTALRKVASVHFGFTGTSGGPVGVVGQTLVTGGAVSQDGTRIALRTYTDVYVWTAPGGDVVKALTSGKPTRLALPATAQGEAVAFTPDGRSLLTSTEKLPAPVHLVPLPGATPSPSTSVSPSPSRSPSPQAGSEKSGGWNTLGAFVVAGGLAALVIWGYSKIRRQG